MEDNKEIVVENPTNGQITKAQVEKLEADYEALVKKNAEKVYGLPIKNEEERQLFIDFIDNDVEWKYMEAFGIPKIYEALNREDLKGGKLYMKGIEVEALSFYLMKITGKGRASAEKFLKMKEIVDVAYKMRENDNKEAHQLALNLEQTKTAFEQGISVEQGAKNETEAGAESAGEE